METTPAIANPGAGSAQAAIDVLRADTRVRLYESKPDAMGGTATDLVRAGADRVIVCGGDGTLATVAAALVDGPTALAIVPGGTLNHFARAHAIPLEPTAALEVALGGARKPVDIGQVNDRLFLNTSSVGVYATFVRVRQRWKRWLGYYLASGLAALHTFIWLRNFDVEIEVDGAARRFHSPLVFLGVDERELQPPKLGDRKDAGRQGLHILVVRRTTRRSLVAMTFRAIFKGVRYWGAEKDAESLIVQECCIQVRNASSRIAVDGEIISLPGPFRYCYKRAALTVVGPMLETLPE